MNFFISFMLRVFFRWILLAMVPMGGGVGVGGAGGGRAGGGGDGGAGGDAGGGNANNNRRRRLQEERDDEDPIITCQRLRTQLDLVQAERNQLQADLLQARDFAETLGLQLTQVQTELANLRPVFASKTEELKKEQERYCIFYK